MIRLFVSDVDGCIAEPFRPFDLDVLTAIAQMAGRGSSGRVPETPPAFTLCTGRPYAYVEAVTQMLGLAEPVLFEAGGGMFDPVAAQTRWHPDFTVELEEQLEALRPWLADLVRGTTLSVDLGKKTQAGVIGPSRQDVIEATPPVREHVAQRFPGLVVATTSVSIDIMARNLTKASGLEWLGRELGLDPADMAFIGDTEGDLGGLGIVGHSFAPANADPEVRAIVKTVTRGRVAEGVLEAYRLCDSMNRPPG